MSKLGDELRRFNPWPIVSYNSSAAYESDSSRWLRLSLIVPTLTVAASFAFRFRYGDLTALLSAVTLLVGAMISAFTFLANLRVKVSEVDEYRVRPRLKKAISSAAVATLYVCLSALGLALAIASTFAVPILGPTRGAGVVSSAIITGLLAHLLMSFLSVLRRMFGLYVELFSGDYAADPEPEPGT
jgi:hypothetical protein